MRFIVAFLWVLAPLALWGMIQLWGTPHVAVSYTFHDNGRRYDPLAPRHYITCTWIGISGAFTLPAERGRCPWVRLLKARP